MPPQPPPVVVLSPSLAALAERGTVRRWRKGSVLIEEGEQGDEIFIILSGRLRVYSRNARDREITFGTYGPGEYVGEMSLDGGARSASVEAAEPSECARVTRHTLLEHLRERPEFALELLGKVIARARAATLTARQLALNDVYGRLKALLESLAGPEQPDGWRALEQRPTHQDIARRLGCSREMVSRLLKDLVRAQRVSIDGDRWMIARQLPPQW